MHQPIEAETTKAEPSLTALTPEESIAAVDGTRWIRLRLCIDGVLSDWKGPPFQPSKSHIEDLAWTVREFERRKCDGSESNHLLIEQIGEPMEIWRFCDGLIDAIKELDPVVVSESDANPFEQSLSEFLGTTDQTCR
jgi:hypothetical protein